MTDKQLFGLWQKQACNEYFNLIYNQLKEVYALLHRGHVSECLLLISCILPYTNPFKSETTTNQTNHCLNVYRDRFIHQIDWTRHKIAYDLLKYQV